MAGSYLSITQGDSYSFSTTVTLDSVEQNIVGATVSLWAVANPDFEGPTVLINVNTSSGVSISGNNNANITVTLNSDYTANIPQANVGFWFLRAETSGGQVYTLDRGRLAVVPGFAPLPL
jgi:uncharacterized lipoprotein YajG